MPEQNPEQQYEQTAAHPYGEQVAAAMADATSGNNADDVSASVSPATGTPSQAWTERQARKGQA